MWIWLVIYSLFCKGSDKKAVEFGEQTNNNFFAKLLAVDLQH